MIMDGGSEGIHLVVKALGWQGWLDVAGTHAS